MKMLTRVKVGWFLFRHGKCGLVAYVAPERLGLKCKRHQRGMVILLK